jgi:hypothetical protein
MPILTQAIMYLRPDVDFANTDRTLVGIRWDTLGVVPPTQAEVDVAIATLTAPLTADDSRALTLRRAADLEKSPDLVDQIEGLRLRLSLLGG